MYPQARRFNIAPAAGRQMSASGGFMMQVHCDTAPPHAAPRCRPGAGGFVTIGTLILASVSAFMLVLMSGCHSAPVTHAFASTAADRGVEARLQQPQALPPPLQPFDEHLGAEIVGTD
jgi:hypothetical protein